VYYKNTTDKPNMKIKKAGAIAFIIKATLIKRNLRAWPVVDG